MASNVAQSSNLLRWEFEGKTGMIQPYVIPSLPFSLWGRDIMEDMDLKLAGATESLLHEDKISWKSKEPMWLNQWPLTEEKIQAIE